MREKESAPTTSSGSRPTSNSKNTKKKYKMMHALYPYTFFFILLVQYCFVDTKRKREGISTDVLEVLSELGERAAVADLGGGGVPRVPSNPHFQTTQLNIQLTYKYLFSSIKETRYY